LDEHEPVVLLLVDVINDFAFLGATKLLRYAILQPNASRLSRSACESKKVLRFM
jgi:hypothetical protein